MRTPKKTHTVGISWELFQRVKNKAIEKETSIQKIVEDSIRGGFSEKGEAPSKEKVYACPECGKEFDQKKSLQGHMLGAHNEGIGEKEIDYELKNA